MPLAFSVHPVDAETDEVSVFALYAVSAAWSVDRDICCDFLLHQRIPSDRSEPFSLEYRLCFVDWLAEHFRLEVHVTFFLGPHGTTLRTRC